MINLKEIKARIEKATPGPWKFHPANEHDDWIIHNSEFTFVKQDDSGVPLYKADGEFIAHARTDLPLLVKALEKCIEVLKLTLEPLEWWSTDYPNDGAMTKSSYAALIKARAPLQELQGE